MTIYFPVILRKDVKPVVKISDWLIEDFTKGDVKENRQSHVDTRISKSLLKLQSNVNLNNMELRLHMQQHVFWVMA